jgi:hypothetical protein
LPNIRARSVVQHEEAPGSFKDDRSYGWDS